MRRFNVVTLCLLVSSALFLSCSSPARLYQTSPKVQALMQKKADYPEARFIVLADLHYFAPELGTSGKAFQAYLDKDRKLLAESSELLSVAAKQIENLKADFVIVCGDLTKDGERLSHQGVAKKLSEIVASGKGVFIVPGNHDILNGESVAFDGDNARHVENVTPTEFSDIYEDFGYAASLDQDPDSLSYLAEPVPDLWLLALDSCLWRLNKPGKHSHTGGSFGEATLQWIESILIRAKRENKAVMVAMHHGILEHYPSNDDYYPKYLVNHHEKIAEMFAQYDVKLVFSGHFHAQDITRKQFEKNKKVIYDIETGSLVTSPCPYRTVDLTFNQKAVIKSHFINTIPSHPEDFPTYRDQYVFDGTIKLADAALKSYGVSEKDRRHTSPQIAQAYSVHLKGDEIKPESSIHKDGMGLWGRIILALQGDLIDGWYTDLPPADNQVTIDLSDGTYENH
jgi:3',5'-cyclic AMP phosphodiesterase CpdA